MPRLHVCRSLCGVVHVCMCESVQCVDVSCVDLCGVWMCVCACVTNYNQRNWKLETNIVVVFL